jgi:hypothetical protein
VGTDPGLATGIIKPVDLELGERQLVLPGKRLELRPDIGAGDQSRGLKTTRRYSYSTVEDSPLE